jgi:hypothetical protein
MRFSTAADLSQRVLGQDISRHRSKGGDDSCKGNCTLKFTPRQTIVLQSNDGAEIKAKPFFYSTTSGEGLLVELYSENGERLHVVDADRGVYSLDEAGTLLTLKTAT